MQPNAAPETRRSHRAAVNKRALHHGLMTGNSWRISIPAMRKTDCCRAQGGGDSGLKIVL
jgi:hypothetical protein